MAALGFAISEVWFSDGPSALAGASDVHPMVGAASPDTVTGSNHSSTSDREPKRSVPDVDRIEAPRHEADVPASRLDDKTRQQVDRYLRDDWRTMDAGWASRASEPGSGPNGEKTLSDAIKDMASLVALKKYEVALQLLAQDDYTVFAAGSQDVEGAQLPRGHSPLRMYNIEDSTGRPVDILFAVSDDHPLIAEFRQELRIMRSAQNGADVALFNDLSESTRKQKIAAHRAALADVGVLRRDLTMPAEERQRRFAALAKDLLPAAWVIVADYVVVNSGAVNSR